MNSLKNLATTVLNDAKNGKIINKRTSERNAEMATTSANLEPPKPPTENLFISNFGKFERIGATYSWCIEGGNKKLVGHSKAVAQLEKDNKQTLLKDCIIRLDKKGYIKDGMTLEFYRNMSNYDRDSIKIFTLYGKRFVPESCILGQEWLLNFLKEFYLGKTAHYGSALFPTGEENKRVVQPTFPEQTGRNHLSENIEFRDMDDLLNYTDKLKSYGYEHGEVADYFRKIVDKNPRLQ